MSQPPNVPAMPPGRWRRLLRWAAVVLALPVCLLTVGATCELTASVLARRAAAGTAVDVGGRSIHVLCIGSGSPTVVFNQGVDGEAGSFPGARRALAAVTRVCSLDRMGSAGSKRGPSTVSVGQLADDLRRGLDGVGLTEPVILVASSIGGWESEYFARRHPERVAGLVMLDAANSWVLTAVAANIPPLLETKATRACNALDLAAPTGLVRLLVGPPGPLQTMCAMFRGLRATYAEFVPLALMRRDLPLAVLSAETSAGLIPAIPFATARLERIADGIRPQAIIAQQLLARQSARGTWQMVEGSGHLIAHDRPIVVVETVEAMVESLRRK